MNVSISSLSLMKSLLRLWLTMHLIHRLFSRKLTFEQNWVFLDSNMAFPFIWVFFGGLLVKYMVFFSWVLHILTRLITRCFPLFAFVLIGSSWCIRKLTGFLHRHISSYCTSQALCFLQIKCLWQPWIKQVYWCHFSNSICSLCVSVSHFGNFHNIFNFFIIIIICYGDHWSVIFDITIVIILGAPQTIPT